MSARKRVLIICTGNSARSQMAEALINAELGACWQAVSGGTEPAPTVHPLAVRAMAEIGIDISDRQPKSVELFHEEPLDAVITVCDHARQTCPLWLGQGTVTHIGFPDPAAAVGSEEERLEAFCQVRDAIRREVLPFLRNLHPC